MQFVGDVPLHFRDFFEGGFGISLVIVWEGGGGGGTGLDASFELLLLRPVR